ncbi:hypothetical protein Ae201684P_022435 [Aphanomyces euteiches]|uniref:Uncharacterized protein n=1 Tax=Aphanomyces euteiches TaxID=100861 RepID=A0A6G0X6J1_9STRA|nr:hypothetical protein Ae201684_008010 [Aphanomyces euteiches]KAH9074633.1 hypothetical protein Ae201684P_022435 [Aphanomyces euteiches]
MNQLRIAEDFDKEWLTKIMTCSELPDLSHLVEKVSGPLRILIPIANPAGLFAHLNSLESPPTQSIHQVFEENAAKHCPEVMKRIQKILFDVAPVATTENSFIGFWDNIILQTLLVIFQRTGCSWDRNSSKETSTLSDRPDFIFRLLHVCVFRGEEERSGEDQEVPRNKLIDKLVWTYGEAPYLFGYSVCGFELRLHAILPPCKDNEQKEQGRRPCKIPRMPTCSTIPLGFFHLDTVCGCLDLFRSLVNISPYLLRIAKLCPRRNRPEYTVCVRVLTRNELIWKKKTTI